MPERAVPKKYRLIPHCPCGDPPDVECRECGAYVCEQCAWKGHCECAEPEPEPPTEED